MNYKEQQAMVERLKNNWVVVGGLTLDEKAFLEKHIRSCIEIDIYGRGEEAELPLRIGSLVRLSEYFQLPAPAIEPPEGYRIVSMEDRKRCKYPVDCEVVCYRFGAWWDYPSGNLWTKEEAEYAVPESYTFAEDRPKEELCFVEYPITVVDKYTLGYRCVVKHIHNSEVPIHKLPSIVGFTGDILFRYSDGSEQWRYTLTDRNRDGTPATPIKARFYINGEMK